MTSKGKGREEASRRGQGIRTSHPGAQSMFGNGIEGLLFAISGLFEPPVFEVERRRPASPPTQQTAHIYNIKVRDPLGRGAQGFQALDLGRQGVAFRRHSERRSSRGLPRRSNRQLGTLLQARPAPKLGPRHKWGRSGAETAARDMKKNHLKAKAGSARRPPNRPRKERFLYGGPQSGPKIWTPLLRSPRPKVRPGVKGKSKAPSLPCPCPWAS